MTKRNFGGTRYQIFLMDFFIGNHDNIFFLYTISKRWKWQPKRSKNKVESFVVVVLACALLQKCWGGKGRAGLTGAALQRLQQFIQLQLQQRKIARHSFLKSNTKKLEQTKITSGERNWENKKKLLDLGALTVTKKFAENVVICGAACSQSQMWCFLGVRLICEVLWSECCREETTAGCTQNNPFLIFGYCSQQQNNGHNQQQQAETSVGVDDSGSQNGQNELVLMTMAIWWIQLLTGISGTKILLAMLMSRCFGCIHSSDCQESVHQWGYWTDKSTTISCATESGIW